MFKFIAVTLAAIFVILQVFGDAERRPAVAREAVEGLTLAAFSDITTDEIETKPVASSAISDSDAIRMAVEAGKQHRATVSNTSRAVATLVVTKSEAPTSVESVPTNYWYVSGNRVNVRRGPGTANAVVGQVTRGMEAEVLDVQDGWMQIVTKDGTASGWISGDFLKEQRPG